MKKIYISKNTEKYDVAIIGGGPAGIMTAISASEKGVKVVLIEKNHKLGTKLLLTGGRRCNLTNAEITTKNLKDFYGKEADFLMKSFLEFGVKETIQLFEKRGLECKVEDNGRVFPVTHKASDIVKVLLDVLDEGKVEILYNSCVKEIEFLDKKIKRIILENGKTIKAKNYVICTGGKSFGITGSTGDGYNFAEKLGHKIVTLKPALVPIKIKEDWVKSLQGISLKDIELKVFLNDKKVFSKIGEIMFAHFGLSGPLAIAISNNVGNKIILDLMPNLLPEDLDKKLQNYFSENPVRTIKNCLSDFVPEKVGLVIINMVKINQDKKANTITRKERQELVWLFKNLQMSVEGLLDFNVAMATSGGIDLKEIDAKTMQSKLIDNLFFAGEIINLCGVTGGFNLQLCWSTGYLAGRSVAKTLDK